MQQRREIREALADRTAQDEEVGPEECLHAIEIDVDPLHPGAPVEILHRLDVGRSEFLRVHAVQLHVPELGVGEKPAVDEQRRPYAGAEGQHDDRAFDSPAGAQAHLREAGRVRIVQEERVAIQRAPDERGSIGTDPGMIDVGGSARLAALDHGGKREPDRTRGGGQLRGEPRYRRHHALRARGLRGGRRDQVTDEVSGLDVNHTRLDEGAPDVDTQQFTRHRRFSR